MKEYAVTITETLEKVVFISADNQTEAEELAREQWNSGIYILDADNFDDVSFRATEVLINTP